MGPDSDVNRIRRKAHELWEADGHPHGRDQDHWDQAREIIAIEDSQASTLLPRETGAQDVVETRSIAENYGDLPILNDQGEHALTDTSREPAVTQPASRSPEASSAPALAGKSRKAPVKAPGKAPPQPDAIASTVKQPNPAVRATGAASIAAGAAKSSSRKAPTSGKVN